MAFSVDHDKVARGRYLPPEGEYETVIKAAKPNVTREGIPFLDFRLTIREDVKQVGQGETIRYAVWRRKTPAEFDPEGYPAGVVQSLLRCAGIQNGVRFESLKECLNCLAGLMIRVRVKHEEINGAIKARVCYILPPMFPLHAQASGEESGLPF